MPNDTMPREHLRNRLGFLLMSAGCAIGLGNVWRFPFITGEYGGGAFVLLYLVFLVILGLPAMVMEFSVGRAAQLGIGHAFKKLEPKGTFWHIHGYTGILANVILMMYYTTVTGWMLAYCWYEATGQLHGLTPDQVGTFFGTTLSSAPTMLFWMAVTVLIGSLVCSRGLQKGSEKMTKIMMLCLLLTMIILVLRTVTLDGAMKGLEFYLKPDFNRMMEKGLDKAVFAAMGQAFFTLSLGIGALGIFGSYTGKERSLTGESVNVIALDTLVAFMAGLIIFPACFAFNVDAGAGPGLIFVTLPNVFNSMHYGRIWGTLFFIFMSFAALTTVVAVFENIISYAIDAKGWSRKKASLIVGVIILVTSVPCALGFNVWSGFQPLGAGTGVLDLEDFIVSNNLLPLGSLVYVLFCTHKIGWGWDNFIKEADQGTGLKFPSGLRLYFKYGLPLVVLYVFVKGYMAIFLK